MPRRTQVASTVGVLLASLPAASAAASEIGDEIAAQVSAAAWQHYLDDLLYTHAGNNRSITGPQHNLARENIVATFQSFGLAVERDEFVYASATYQNIIATKPGRLYPDQAYVIGAHYDSVGNAGADDDASGVASLLELARIFAQYDTAYTIKFCAWDAEEVGLRGSTAYVGERRDQLIRGMVQLDMIAHNAGLNRQDIYAGALATGLRDQLVAAFPLYGAGQGVQTNPYAGFSDHAPFDAARYAAVCFVEDNYQSNNCYHASCDNVDNPNYIHYDFAANFVRVIGGFLADNALAMHAGDCDNDGTPDADELAADPLLDCNGNGVLDSCEPNLIRDCNGNAAPDVCDIAGGESLDRDRNGYPDECAATRLVPTDYATIQAAINAAVNGDTILVAPGVYSGAGNTGLDFGGKALTLRSSAGADQTIIQCTSTTSGIVLQTGEDRRCVIEGLTIMGGNVGISCTGASPNIRNCVISGHHAGNSGGGGIFLTRRSRPVIANCAVIGNSTTGPGGGVCCTLGASPLLLNSVIAGNSGANGGGLYCEQTSQAALRNCTLARNITAGRGGALYTLNSTALDNSSATLENCILWGNTAGAGQGEAIYVGQNTLVAAYYCDIQGGQAGVVGIGTILAWDHCLNVNPAFVNAGLNDYALLANSGCIDAGSNPRAGQDVGDVDFDGDAAEPPPVDLTGRPRFADRATTPDTGEGAAPLIDLGAQEYPPAACRADFDGDGAISISDLSILLSNFGCVPAPDACVGDTDGDGDVQLADLAELLSAFGQSCR